MSSCSIGAGLKLTFLVPPSPLLDESHHGYDVVIQFLSAEDLPKKDIFGHADPYFTANIDDKIVFTSCIQHDTLAPTWNDEEWIVRNVPRTAKLCVSVHDKDDETLTDDYIGHFEVADLIHYEAPPGGHEIIGEFGHPYGRFHLSILSTQPSPSTQQLPRYTFDGPCRYIRNDSYAIGHLTMLNTDCVYSTWKIRMRRISSFFDPQKRQEWNKNYMKARTVFGDCPLSLIVQNSIKIAHKMLYGQTVKHSVSGRLTNGNDLWKFIFMDKVTQRVKPCLYTYIIDDNMWRFSETSAGFFTDLASKHSLLANASKNVRYAGEFHPRPRYGWDRLDDEWELVIDNDSGTYTPNVELLVNLKELLVFNFPGLNVVTYDYKDPRLKASIEQLKEAKEKFKNSMTTTDQIMLAPEII